MSEVCAPLLSYQPVPLADRYSPSPLLSHVLSSASSSFVSSTSQSSSFSYSTSSPSLNTRVCPTDFSNTLLQDDTPAVRAAADVIGDISVVMATAINQSTTVAASLSKRNISLTVTQDDKEDNRYKIFIDQIKSEFFLTEVDKYYSDDGNTDNNNNDDKDSKSDGEKKVAGNRYQNFHDKYPYLNISGLKPYIKNVIIPILENQEKQEKARIDSKRREALIGLACNHDADSVLGNKMGRENSKNKLPSLIGKKTIESMIFKKIKKRRTILKRKIKVRIAVR